MKNCEEKLEDFLWDDSLIHDDIMAESYAFRHGWKAALEWVKREAISLDERGDISRNIINKELNDEVHIQD